MMTFAVGYQLADEQHEGFVDIVRDYRAHIGEVYFPWVHMPSGRASLTESRGLVDWTAQAALEHDLAALAGMGVKLDLLLNANCYGGQAVSLRLENQVGSLIAHLQDMVGGPQVVTTASLAVARTVKTHFPEIDVRASVNMRIGTVQGMQAVSGLFDSFYVQRDRQRDVEHLAHLREWTDQNDKRLCILANSGCLRYCPGQTFHDNMVAHELEIDETANIPKWTPHVCWNLYRDRQNWPAILQATWIRPEDLRHYKGLVDTVKLATRMHVNPRMVIHAYTSGQFRGNLLDLFEPGFGPAFAPYVLDSTRIPDDWFEHTSRCDSRCHLCEYCRGVLEEALVNTEDPAGMGG